MGGSISLPILGLWYITPYQLIWQSTRALAALLPLAICYCLARRRIEDPTQRRFLFASASTLAWISLNQFPFAAPIYFCYVTPLALIAGVALCGTSSRLRSRTILPWTAMMLLFTMLSSHRAYIETLGVLHAPRRFDARLNLPRAHLKVSPDDVETYRRVVFSIARHGRGGQLLAGPDCPEVYFLSGMVNPSRALFDFFSLDTARPSEDALAAWSKGDVIVINLTPGFTPKPSGGLLEKLRLEFPNGEHIGKFEVRWR